MWVNCFVKHTCIDRVSETKQCKTQPKPYFSVSLTGDAFKYQRNKPFTTMDADYDDSSSLNCAVDRKGGFWFQSCGHANLNGLYLNGALSGDQIYHGIRWHDWKANYSMKRAEMKIRPHHINE